MSQTQRLLDLLRDGEPHRTDEILVKVYGNSHLGLARISARIWDLQKKGHIIRGYRDRNPALFWYELLDDDVIK